MGSEHYCLRWSNHQSNLLGVFSQLLQDESLVDVTLACSEGASIRAHKVVLSACSSYFQSLFLDHPEKHPIVILKDVRLSELQTLVEFMYKGEVNVQYCQLSALLKTAESLKVKGLAEMTNQNTALREPEREPDRLRSSHSQQSSTAKSSSGVSIAAPTSSAATAASSSSSICDPQCSMETSSPNLIGSGSGTGSTICASSLSQQQQQTQISTNSSSVLASISTTNSNFNLAVKRENDRCSPSPPKRLHSSAPSSSPLPLDLYQRRCPSSRSDRHRRLDEEHDLSTSSMGGGGAGNTNIGSGCGGSGSGSGGGGGGISGRLSRTPTTINDEQLSPGSCGLLGDKEREKERDRDKHNNSTDDDDDCIGPNSIGINMTINSSSSNNGIQSGGRDSISNRISSGGNDGGVSHTSSSQTVVVPPLNTSNTQTSSFHTSDLRPSSRSGGSGTGNVNITHTATSSGISSPIISTEPVAGPSGLGPVQSVPLSLKKEIDWERSDDKSGDTIDYRHSHDSIDEHVIPNFPRSLSAHPATGRCQSSFPLPFTSPLGLGLFDTDPSRILAILHHQALLAEETLRYRGLLFSSPKEPIRFNSITDILASSKDHDFLNKHAAMYKSQSLFNNNNNSNINNPNYNNNNNIANRFSLTPTNISQTTSHYHHSHNLLARQQHEQQREHQKQQPQQPQHQQQQQQKQPQHHNRKAESSPPYYQKDSILEELKKRSEETVQREEEAEMAELALNGNTSSSASKDSLNDYLRRGAGGGSCSSLGDTSSCLRYTTSTETSSTKEKSSSSSTSSTPPPLSKSTSSSIMSTVDSLLFSEPIEEETHCVVCNAQFPNVWLLEQHAALQHPCAGPEDKPFICEQCGQSYRYRSAYAKHKEQNHRARLPADKLFTCDVCGMQFRYLKSFKKHRLNHALERLHGKKERRNMLDNQHPNNNNNNNNNNNSNNINNGNNNQEIVTSSNEMLHNEVADLRMSFKREKENEEEQDNTVDSVGIGLGDTNSSSSATPTTTTNLSTPETPPICAETKITSSESLYSTNKRGMFFLQPRLISPQIEPESSQQMHQMPTTSLNTLINAERIPSEQLLGLNPQEASILNFLRVDAAERQRDKRTPSSRFSCPFCGKCVRSKENLKLHVRKHTGERPFVCLFCGRAFGGKSDLTRHLRIHTGERPYHCESCGKCFARADYLSKHLTTHIHNAPR
ncbi:myb-like protein A [Condylostylus longicornis]|uniref:myb-like protein A n=1 Tax=Condylostylus longicornis TaxID=2530218 RepID=UPI00244E293F|nr:myb-like protein A [Condylostylus longicornis]